jgi:hypothetical protein
MAARRMRHKPRTGGSELVETVDSSLLDVLDNVLNKGVVVRGEAMLGVAGIDLIYLRLTAVLCAADRVFPPIEK